jgi:putative transposase
MLISATRRIVGSSTVSSCEAAFRIRRHHAVNCPLHAVEPSLLREAFRWSVMRRVTATASVSLAGNRYTVDEALVGRRVELRFDPEDLTKLDVYWEGHPAGQAIPFILGRHVHRQVPQAQPPTPPPPTGVDYLGLVLAAHDAETIGRLVFRDLPVQQAEEPQP